MKRLLPMLLAALLAAATPRHARAETHDLRIGLQYGLVYMQLVLMQHHDFIGPRARAAGMPDLKVSFVTAGGPAVLNDSVIAGGLDVVAVGLSNLVTLWDKTQTNIRVRGISGMNVMPLLLVTSDPGIHSIKDYRPADRIALPSVKVSMQAMMLDLLAARAFGEAGSRKLDPNTVSMSHPDAAAGLIGGGGAFTSHFSAPPYQHFELAAPGIHQVASSFDAIGPHSVSALAATTRFRTQNPKVVAVFLAAMQDATDFINQHKHQAAMEYLAATHDKLTPDALVALMTDPGVRFTLQPEGAMNTAAYMFKAGIIKHDPKSWHDLYFDTVAPQGGS